MNKSKAIEAVYLKMPFVSPITDLDITTEPSAIRFTWRSTRFRVSGDHPYRVDQVGDGVLIGSDMAILIRELLNK